MSVVGNNCAENDPKAMAKKQKSGAMALVGVTAAAPVAVAMVAAGATIATVVGLGAC